MEKHMTGSELAHIAVVDIKLMDKTGNNTGAKVSKKLIEEIKACWLKMESMKANLKEFVNLTEGPKVDPQAGQRMWYD